jgi:hypothetical protein
LAGDLRIEGGWTQSRPDLTLEDCVSHIDESNSWVILKHAEEEPEYRAIMNRCVLELQELSDGRLSSETGPWELQIMITSPDQLTPYHFDNESNFLFQISGLKTINVFDQSDRDVLTEEELECFWAVNENSARYKPQFQGRASAYRLAPGSGIHLPVNAPHWLKNDRNVSISVSINCEIAKHPEARVRQANYYIRRLGLSPAPPGRSLLRDKLKRVAVEQAIKVKKILRRAGL